MAPSQDTGAQLLGLTSRLGGGSLGMLLPTSPLHASSQFTHLQSTENDGYLARGGCVGSRRKSLLKWSQPLAQAPWEPVKDISAGPSDCDPSPTFIAAPATPGRTLGQWVPVLGMRKNLDEGEMGGGSVGRWWVAGWCHLPLWSWGCCGTCDLQEPGEWPMRPT